ncbi:MAG: carbohydrate ABC transporter permease [Clostridiaceae bacterium]|nr:carbohydrate ABC transporter permease [Clostridiaceae bacterium]
MRKHRKSVWSHIFDVFNIILMLFICFICLAPIVHVVFASVSEPGRLALHTGILLKPLGFTTVGYQLIFSNSVILVSYLNTLFYLAAGLFISMSLTLLGGYVLSRRNFLWRNAIMFFITFTMFFSGGLIPFYIVVTKLGLYNTRWAVILPSAVSVFNLIIMRTSMQEIPESLEESAFIEGAGHFTILIKIMAPLSKATIAVIALFYAVSIWNSWFNASIFLTDRNKYPLQLVLKEILVANDSSQVVVSSTDTTGINTDIYKPLVKYCTIVVSILPVLCFYPFTQKYFIKGVMIGSIKG